jgi:hypothetical protein
MSEEKIYLLIAWGFAVCVWFSHLYAKYYFGMTIPEIINEIFGEKNDRFKH